MFRNLLCASLLLAVLAPGLLAWSWSSEITGNEAFSDGNFDNWPGVAQVVNCPSRLYVRRGNGDISCYFHGDTAALNEAIARFADVSMPAEVTPFQRAAQPLVTDVPRHEVIFQPGPATFDTFDSAGIAFDWKLNIIDGLFETLDRKDSATHVFGDCPILTIYIGDGNIHLEDVQIPRGVSLVRPADLRDRYLAGLKSVDPTERGIAAGWLAALNAYSPESIPPIAELLRDPDAWVQSSARFSLRFLGKPARPILVNELERSDLKEAELKSLREGIQFIDDTAVDTEAAVKFHAHVAEIDAFVTRHNQAAQAAKIQE